MHMSPVNSIGAASGSASMGNSVQQKPAAGSGSEGNQFLKMLEGANTQQLKAEEAVQELAGGDASSIHNVVLTAAKADLSFRLVLELRNKLIESYQEIMRMQV